MNFRYHHFCEPLRAIITQYVRKEPPVAADIILNLINHWPNQSGKEVQFLEEIESILEIMEPEHFERIPVV